MSWTALSTAKRTDIFAPHQLVVGVKGLAPVPSRLAVRACVARMRGFALAPRSPALALQCWARGLASHPPAHAAPLQPCCAALGRSSTAHDRRLTSGCGAPAIPLGRGALCRGTGDRGSFRGPPQRAGGHLGASRLGVRRQRAHPEGGTSRRSPKSGALIQRPAQRSVFV